MLGRHNHQSWRLSNRQESSWESRCGEHTLQYSFDCTCSSACNEEACGIECGVFGNGCCHLFLRQHWIETFWPMGDDLFRVFDLTALIFILKIGHVYPVSHNLKWKPLSPPILCQLLLGTFLAGGIHQLCIIITGWHAKWLDLCCVANNRHRKSRVVWQPRVYTGARAMSVTAWRRDGLPTDFLGVIPPCLCLWQLCVHRDTQQQGHWEKETWLQLEWDVFS